MRPVEAKEKTLCGGVTCVHSWSDSAHSCGISRAVFKWLLMKQWSVSHELSQAEWFWKEPRNGRKQNLTLTAHRN